MGLISHEANEVGSSNKLHHSARGRADCELEGLIPLLGVSLLINASCFCFYLLFLFAKLQTFVATGDDSSVRALQVTVLNLNNSNLTYVKSKCM